MRGSPSSFRFSPSISGLRHRKGKLGSETSKDENLNETMCITAAEEVGLLSTRPPAHQEAPSLFEYTMTGFPASRQVDIAVGVPVLDTFATQVSPTNYIRDEVLSRLTSTSTSTLTASSDEDFDADLDDLEAAARELETWATDLTGNNRY